MLLCTLLPVVALVAVVLRAWFTLPSASRVALPLDWTLPRALLAVKPLAWLAETGADGDG